MFEDILLYYRQYFGQTMDQSQSLNYSDIEDDFELDFAIQQLDHSFHPVKPGYSSIFQDDVNNNGIENAKAQLSDIMSSSLNGFALVGNDKRLEDVGNKPGIANMSDGLEDNMDENKLSVSYLTNCLANSLDMNSSDQIDNPVPDILKNRHITHSEDFVLTQNLLNFERELEIGSEKRKLTETNRDFIDGLDGEEFYALDQNIFETHAQSTSFETTNLTSSVRSNGNENVENMQTDPKRKRKKTSETTDAEAFSTTNFNSTVSSKGIMTQSARPAGRGRSRRKARTRNRRSETEYLPEFDDFSPAPSPEGEAEVPNSPSVVNTETYVDDNELMTLDTKELNKRVKFLPKPVVNEIKHRRRTLKNRGYARSCREKKMTETETLQRSNTDLEKELASKKLELELALFQRDGWKHKYEQLVLSLAKQGMNVQV